MRDPGVVAEQSAWKTRLALLLPLAGYAIFFAQSVFVRPNPKWAFLLLLWALGAALLSWWLSRGGAKQTLDWLDRHAGSIAKVIILVVCALWICISVLQVRYFALSLDSEETAYHSQMLWNTLHGHFLSGNVEQERLVNPPASHQFALHVSPLLLGLLPIYVVFPHFLTLLIIRDIVITIAAWPLFLLARERIGGAAGVAAVILYLANPAVMASGFEAFNLLQLTPLPFFWAFRAFVREELGLFLSWIGVAIGLREDVAITMAGFGLWALVRRRQFRWSALTLGIPVIWWGLATLIIQPAFRHGGSTTLEGALGGSKTPLGIYKILLGSPSWILDGLHAGGFKYLYQLLRPVAFLGVVGGAGLLAAPGILANLFLGARYFAGGDPMGRFAILPSCALVGATLIIVTRMGRKYCWDMRVFALMMLLLVPSVSLLDGVKDVARTELWGKIERNDAAALREAVKLVPDTASVAAPNYALPALSNRRKLFWVIYIHAYPHAQPDYILLDRSLYRMPANRELRARYLALLDSLPHSTDYQTVWQRGEYLLLRRINRNQ